MNNMSSFEQSLDAARDAMLPLSTAVKFLFT